MGGLAAGCAGWHAWRAPDRERLVDVSMLLYGQDDPEGIEAAGFHGLGGRPVRVRIEQRGRCRFALSAAGESEVVDFGEVADIRHALVDDPAAGIARIVGSGAGHGGAPQLPVAIITGAEDAVCRPGGCVGTRAFALKDADRLDGARRAAAGFRSRFCPGIAAGSPALRGR